MLYSREVQHNPLYQAEPPPTVKPDPHPPSPAEAASLLNEAWKDLDWGAFVWLAMTAGARRGELCALHWEDIVLESGVIRLRRALYKDTDGAWKEKDTKTHQQRRIALDAETIQVLTDHHRRCQARAAGIPLPQAGYVFSLESDASTPLIPDTATQRFSRMAERLNLNANLHALRHYSATELIAAGVDIRTVAGRLGHGGGGVTTLRVYAAWVAEADQPAASTLAGRMPKRPGPVASSIAIRRVEPIPEPRSPYESIAAALRSDIMSGHLGYGDPLLSIRRLAEQHDVSASTAQAALADPAGQAAGRAGSGAAKVHRGCCGGAVGRRRHDGHHR